MISYKPAAVRTMPYPRPRRSPHVKPAAAPDSAEVSWTRLGISTQPVTVFTAPLPSLEIAIPGSMPSAATGCVQAEYANSPTTAAPHPYCLMSPPRLLAHHPAIGHPPRLHETNPGR